MVCNAELLLLELLFPEVVAAVVLVVFNVDVDADGLVVVGMMGVLLLLLVFAAAADVGTAAFAAVLHPCVRSSGKKTCLVTCKYSVYAANCVATYCN
jgi:hypothetical protein